MLVSAADFGAGLTGDLQSEPVAGTAVQISNSAVGAFPAAATMQPVASDAIPLPRPRVVHEMPNLSIEEVCSTLASAAQSHKLPVTFFIRLIWQESRFDPRAVSPVGAQGLAQFMPETAASMGLKNPFDPLEALHFSARLLRELLGQFGNLGLAAAAYNAGPKRILDWLAKRSKLPEETRNYVKSITGHAAERWRVTRPGRLDVDVPKRAPCKGVTNFAYVVEMPAPKPPPKKRGRAHILAKQKGKALSTAQKRLPVAISVRKAGKARAAVKPAPLITPPRAARKNVNRPERVTILKPVVTRRTDTKPTRPMRDGV